MLTVGMLLCTSASAATITFSGLTGANGTLLTIPYTEGGFTVNTTAGEFFQAQLFGNPIPSLFATLATTDTLDVTGGSFMFAFSNRPVWVKRFQTIHQCCVDVAHGRALLFGIGTKALPSWGPRTRRNNLLSGLAASQR